MNRLYIKQKIFSLSGKFTVKNAQGDDVYFVEGSFLQIPKTFTIFDSSRAEVAMITKKVFSFLPTFFVEVDGREMVKIKKKFSFFKAHYSIEVEGIEVRGNWFDMNFSILRHGEVVGSVSKEWFTWGDSYKVEVLDEKLEKLIIALVVAIDCVKADNSAAATSAAT
ncbi:LURP-one-related/scramblase family protein [Metasolibacillus meyeri]|uniref:LURP-one-related/scramblase family protein n=1 Tax=Metasolibacillus meyeri TaxID=1071052 RepID=UPI000D31E04E|nr:LURP-one-related family protein [Metasolibacillus meyeri]